MPPHKMSAEEINSIAIEVAQHLPKQREGVSVTWKWLAVTALGIAGWLAVNDRVEVGNTLKAHSSQQEMTRETITALTIAIAKLPTREDFNALSQKIDAYRDRQDGRKNLTP